MQSSRRPSPSDLLAHIALPLWGQPLARLHREPEVWAALADETLVQAASALLGDQPEAWRPASLGLLELEQDGPIWNEVRNGSLPANRDSRLEAVRAFETLAQATTKSGQANSALADVGGATPSLREATLAALVLREHLAVADDWGEVLAEPLTVPALWDLPLVCLYGLLQDVNPFLDAIGQLIRDGRGSVTTAARVLLANDSERGLEEHTQRVSRTLSRSQRLDFARALVERGALDAARRVAGGESQVRTRNRTADSDHPPESPRGDIIAALRRSLRPFIEHLEEVEASELEGNYDQAGDTLARAWTEAARIAGGVAAEVGWLSLSADDPTTAEAAFQEAVRCDPSNPHHFAGLAETLVMSNRLQEGLRSLPETLNHPRIHLARARAYQAEGAYELMVASARDAAKPAQNSRDAPPALSAASLAAAADLLAKGNDLPGAVEASRAACALDPNNTAARLALAQYCLQLGRPAEALNSAAEVVLLWPEGVTARTCLARALEAAGRPGQAIEHWAAASYLAPEDMNLKVRQAGAYLKAGDLKEAKKLAQVLASSPGEGHTGSSASPGLAHAVLGRIYWSEGDPSKALPHLKLGVELAPERPRAWIELAEFHSSQGQAEQALNALEAGRAASSVTQDELDEAADLHAALADLYTQTGRANEAILSLRKAITYRPEEPRLHTRVGKLHQAQGDLDQAAEHLRRAAELSPSVSAVAHDLGAIQEARGELTEALESYERAVELAQGGQGHPQSAPQLLFDFGRMCMSGLSLNSYSGLKRTSLAQPGTPDTWTPTWSGQARSEQVVKDGKLRAEKAVRAFQEAANQQPGDLRVLEWLGAAQETAGQPERALQTYREAIRLLHPDQGQLSTALHRGIGRNSLALGQVDIAIAAFREALAATLVPTPELLGDMAAAFSKANMHTEACEAYLRAVESSPEDPALLSGLAKTAQAIGRHGLAVEAYRRALRVRPEEAWLLVDLGETHLAAGQASEARQAFSEAIGKAGASPEIHTRVGQSLLSLGELAEAATILERAASLAPEDASVQKLLGDARSASRKHREAHTAYMRAAELSENRPEYLSLAGEALWAYGETHGALAVWRRALETDPKSASVHRLLGRALAKLGKHAQALPELEQAAQLMPADHQPYVEAAQSALALGQYGRAVEVLSRARDLSPDDENIWGLLGDSYLGLRDMDAAFEGFQRAARFSSAPAVHMAGQARALLGLGRAREAVRTAREARSLDSVGPEALLQLGQVMFDAGQMQEGLGNLEAASSALPEHPQAHLALARALIAKGEADLLASQSAEEGRPPGGQGRQVASRAELLLVTASGLGADPWQVRELGARTKALWGDPATAIPELESAVEGRLSAELFSALATACRRAGLFSRAREAIQAALDIDSQSVNALLQLGLISLEGGEASQAISAFRRAVARIPDSAPARYRLALALEADRNLPEAADELAQALALRPPEAGPDPVGANWHHRLATLQAALGDRAAALAHFQRAAELDPQNGRWAADLAWALAADGDLNASSAMYERATIVEPRESRHWIERGEVLLQLGQVAGATASFARARELAPENGRGLTGSARTALALNQPAAAQEYLEKALALSPGDSSALTCLAEAQAALGKTDQALESYTQSARHAKDPYPALIARARLLLANSRAAQAVQALWQLDEEYPEVDEIKELLGEALVRCGRVDDALAALKQALEIAPRKARHHMRLGQLYQQRGQLDQALAHLEDARELAPDDAEVYLEIGKAFEARRQFGRALEAYQGAIRQDPQDALGYFHAGVALKQLKSLPESISMLRRAVQLDPKLLVAHRQLAAVSAMGLVYGISESANPRDYESANRRIPEPLERGITHEAQ